jgi:hypothetical protein
MFGGISFSLVNICAQSGHEVPAARLSCLLLIALLIVHVLNSRAATQKKDRGFGIMHSRDRLNPSRWELPNLGVPFDISYSFHTIPSALVHDETKNSGPWRTGGRYAESSHRGWVGFVGNTENSLRSAVHPSDHLESLLFAAHSS